MNFYGLVCAFRITRLKYAVSFSRYVVRPLQTFTSTAIEANDIRLGKKRIMELARGSHFVRIMPLFLTVDSQVEH